MIQTRIDLVKKNEKRIHLIYRLPPTVRLEPSCLSPSCHLPPSLCEQCIRDARARTHSFISALWVYDILHTRARIYRRSFATASRYEIAAAVAKARCSRWDRGLSWSRAEHGVDCDRSIDRCQWWTRSIPIETRRRYTRNTPHVWTYSLDQGLKKNSAWVRDIVSYRLFWRIDYRLIIAFYNDQSNACEIKYRENYRCDSARWQLVIRVQRVNILNSFCCIKFKNIKKILGNWISLIILSDSGLF